LTLDTDGEDSQQRNNQRGSELPPLLKKILEEYSATGMPPAYLPKQPKKEKTS